ncbi:unnamed protein product [Oreochromis niloticus]|nr:unnamed protein product [Mustela putorius furo]
MVSDRMSANSSFSSQSTLDLNLSSMNTSISLYVLCLISKPSSYIYRAFSITAIFLVLPVCILILQHGLQEWRKKGSTFMEVLSHSDCFTYNIIIMDLFAVLSSIFTYCGIVMNNLKILSLPMIFYSFSCFGQVFFHILTCVEHYMAAVHPITYRSLRKERWVRIRNISIGCVWLLCFALTGFIMINDIILAIVNICLVTLSITVSSFCSLSVLCVLIHSGPREESRNRDRVDQSKKRAFYTIVTILGMLALKSLWDLNWSVVYITGGLNGCILMSWGSWFNIPSNLLLPLLFLYRKGKFVCCKKNME